MRKLMLMLAQCLLLAGCTGLPQPREMGEMALLRTIGVDGGGAEVTLTVSTGQRASGVEGQKEGALVLSGAGESLSSAAFDLRQKSDSYVFFGYVDKLLLGNDPGRISDVLGWFARDGELGLGAKVWLLRGTSAGQAVEAGGEAGVERRLSALELDGKLGAGPMTRTAGEVYGGLLDRNCTFLPALTAEAELLPAGYAVVRGEEVVGFLEEDAARGLELLTERPMAEIIEVSLPENRVSLRLTGAQLDCKPVYQEGVLQTLKLRSRVELDLEQWRREPTASEREAIARAAREILGKKMEQALGQLRDWQTDCIGIGSRVGIAAPWAWEDLEESWPQIFSEVAYQLEVTVALGR